MGMAMAPRILRCSQALIIRPGPRRGEAGSCAEMILSLSWPADSLQCCRKVHMQGFLVSHAIYAIVLFGVLEAMCIPISSELTFLLGGAIASGGVAGTHQHPSLALVIILGT